MSTIALQRPDLSTTWSRRKRDYRMISSSWTIVNSKSIPTRKENVFSWDPEADKFNSSTVKFNTSQQTNRVADNIRGVDVAEFGHFVAREAQLDEEYWTAAWLRAESHWEDKEHDRYVENYKRKFAEQEFNAMKQRYSSQLGEKCTCIVTVRKEDVNVKRAILKSVVGTLDLSIRYLSHGESFPGERVKAPLFCLIDEKPSVKYGYVANLCVAKSARRQGIASNMLRFAIVSAKAQGAEKVFVHAYRTNTSAQGLYQKMGFEVVDAPASDDQTYLLCLEASSYS